MARRVADYQRVASDTVSWHQDKALNTRILLLHPTGIIYCYNISTVSILDGYFRILTNEKKIKLKTFIERQKIANLPVVGNEKRIFSICTPSPSLVSAYFRPPPDARDVILFKKNWIFSVCAPITLWPPPPPPQ